MSIRRKRKSYYMESKQSKHYLYVLQCKDNTYYTGYTNSIEKRIKKHNEGKGAKYTRGRIPVTLVYKQEFETKEKAMQAEYQFKKLNRKQKEMIIRRESTFICGNNIAMPMKE